MDVRAGDTKPVEKEEESSSGSSSSEDGLSTKSEDHYGVINEDHSKATSLSKKNKSDSAYAVFIDPQPHHNSKKH